MARNPPKWIFHNVGNLLQPLEFVPASRERVVPTEWQVQTVLGACISDAKVISIQAPEYRQYALISEFLDLANLSIRLEAILATNWIKDRPEGLKLQKLALATMTGPAVRSQPKNTTADLTNASHWYSEKQLILHGNPSAIARDFSPQMAVLRRHFFAEYAFSRLYDSPRYPRKQFGHFCCHW